MRRMLLVMACWTALAGTGWTQDALLAASWSESSEASQAAPSLTERIESLEQTLSEREEREIDLKKAAASKPSQRWTARIHTDYLAFPGNDAGTNFFETGDPDDVTEDRILMRRLRFGVGGSILETMNYRIEMEWANPNNPTVKDAFLGWTELPCLETLLLGNQKRPYGLDYLNSSRVNVFMERPFVVEAFNAAVRRFGLCSYGLSEDQRFNWRYGAFLPRDIQGSGQYLTADEHDYQTELAGRLASTIWYDETSDGRGYAHLAISGAVVFPDGDAGPANVARFRTRPELFTSNTWLDTGQIVGADAYELLGVEAVLNLGAVQWVTEYQHVTLQRDVGSRDLQFGGVYTYLSWFVTGEHAPWDRATGTLERTTPFEPFFLVRTCDGSCRGGWGAWQVACRYSLGDFTDQEFRGGIGSSISFAVHWWWTAYPRMQFNYLCGEIHDRYDQDISPSTGLPAGPVGPTAGSYQILGTRFMIDF